MVKIWAKVIKENKLVKDIIYESIDTFNISDLYLYMQEICHKMDEPSPVVLKTHENNFLNFNTCTFLSRDFVESVSFDKLVIENAKE